MWHKVGHTPAQLALFGRFGLRNDEARINPLPTRSLVAVDRNGVFTRMERRQRHRRDVKFSVIGDESGQARGLHAVQIHFHVFVVKQMQLYFVRSSAPSVNFRRSQMSALLQVVFKKIPGVPVVPNPPTPSFQAASSNLG